MKKIKLTKGQFAIVDDKNYEYINQFKWYLSGRGYAMREVQKNKKVNKIYMHRVINNTPNNLLTDHINRNQLDNRAKNLRSCTTLQNCQNRKRYSNNTSGYKGVSFNKPDGKWRAYIRILGKLKYLGGFSTPQEASSIYNITAKEYFGVFSWRGV